MTTTATNHSALRLYSVAHETAVTKVGKDVFGFQNDIVKHALVAVEIVNIVNAQDDDADSTKVRQLLFDLAMLNAEQYNRY